MNFLTFYLIYHCLRSILVFDKQTDVYAFSIMQWWNEVQWMFPGVFPVIFPRQLSR